MRKTHLSRPTPRRDFKVGDQKTANAYKDEVLSKGGSEDPEILYRNFRGRDADPDALLRREGIIDKAA